MRNRAVLFAGALAALLLLCAGALYSREKPQDSGEVKEPAPEGGGPVQDGHVKSYPGSFTARASLSYDIMDLDLTDRKFTDRTIRYLRNGDLYAGVSARYENFGIGARVGVADMNRPGNKKVEDYDITANYFSHAFGIDLSYRRYGRFFIKDSPYGIGKLWNGLPDGLHMKTDSAGLNLLFFLKDFLSFNKDFSYGAAFGQTEKQVKSGGTALIEISGNYHRMKNNIPIVPVYAHELFIYIKMFGLRGWQFAGFGIGVGFAYTIVLPRDFFISALISLSFRPMWREYYTFPRAKGEFRIDSLRGRGKVYAGYNGDSFFTGVSLLYEGIFTPCYRYKSEIWSGDLGVEFFAGVRVQAGRRVIP